MYPDHDIEGFSTSIKSCQRDCYSNKDCEVFTYTVNETDPANGWCNLKTTRGDYTNKHIKKNKISGSGTVPCLGMYKSVEL